MIALNRDTVEYIISIAREMREASPEIIMNELAEENEAPHIAEAHIVEIAEYSPVEDHARNNSYQTLKAIIEGLNDEEKAELVALLWIGRGTYSSEEWKVATASAREAANDHTADYLMRTPLLPDYLEDALVQMDEESQDA